MLEVNQHLRIPLREFDFRFSRSGGPGGQNVNKLNTKVTLHWDAASSPSLPADVRERFLKRYARRINRAGQLVLSSERFRDQGRNVADCLHKLREMLLAVAAPPKSRKPTRPTRGSQERRLKQKRQQAERKQARGGTWRSE